MSSAFLEKDQLSCFERSNRRSQLVSGFQNSLLTSSFPSNPSPSDIESFLGEKPRKDPKNARENQGQRSKRSLGLKKLILKETLSPSLLAKRTRGNNKSQLTGSDFLRKPTDFSADVDLAPAELLIQNSSIQEGSAIALGEEIESDSEFTHLSEFEYLKGEKSGKLNGIRGFMSRFRADEREEKASLSAISVRTLLELEEKIRKHKFKNDCGLFPNQEKYECSECFRKFKTGQALGTIFPGFLMLNEGDWKQEVI